jgi:hypothetical protein
LPVANTSVLEKKMPTIHAVEDTRTVGKPAHSSGIDYANPEMQAAINDLARAAENYGKVLERSKVLARRITAEFDLECTCDLKAH